jgi:DNA-binding beta-propeller fold protein YncE
MSGDVGGGGRRPGDPGRDRRRASPGFHDRAAYVAGLGGTVTPISIRTNTPGPPIRAGSSPDAIAITPDGKTAYVTNLNDAR